jgi:hypothetical protein
MPQEEKYTIDEFAKKIKNKYPQYKDMDNSELVDKITKKYPQYNESIVKKKDVSGSDGRFTSDDLRADGTKKDVGFLGELKRPDGGVSTELSIGVDFGEGEREIPTLVPTLNKNEINYLLETDPDKIFTTDKEIFKSIENKAINHAKKRIAEGKSPFYQSGEEKPSGSGFRTVMERSPEGNMVATYKVEKVDPEVFTIDPEADQKKQQEKRQKRQDEYSKIAEDVKPFVQKSKEYVDSELEKIRLDQNYYTGAKYDETFGGYPPVSNAFLRTKQVDRYKATKRLLDDVDKFIKAPTDEGLQAFWKGISSKNTVDLLTLGYSEMFDAMSVADAAQKSRDGRELTSDEQLLLSTKYIMDELQANKDIPSSYNIGAGLAEMIPYISQIALTKGIGGEVTASAKTLAKGELKRIVAKYGLADFAGAAASAPFTGIMWESVAQKRTGQLTVDEKGDVVAIKGTEETPQEAIAKAWMNTSIELFTERFVGEKLSNLKLFGKSAQKTLSTPEKLNAFNKAVSKFRKQANWDGLMSEWGEEQISAIGQAITTGDASIQDLLDLENQFEIFATVAIANGAFKANEIPGYIRKGLQNKQYDNTKKALEIIDDQELKDQVIRSIENAKNIDELRINLVDRGYEQLDPLQQKAILDFVKAKMEKDVVDGMEIASEQEQARVEMAATKEEVSGLEKKASIQAEEVLPETPVKETIPEETKKPPEGITEAPGKEMKTPAKEEAEKKQKLLKTPKIKTKEKVVEPSKKVSDEKRMQEKRKQEKDVYEAQTQDVYKKGQKNEVLTKAEKDARKMGEMRKESESQKPKGRQEGKPLRSVYSEYRADEIGKAIQKVGDIRQKKSEEMIKDAQSMEELDYLLSNNKVPFSSEFKKKKAALREEGNIEDVGRIKDLAKQIAVEKSPNVEQQLLKDLGKDRFEELKDKKKEVISRMAERAARISGAKFAVGEDGKRPDVIQDLVGLVKDLVELGSINLEMGTRAAIDKLKKYIGTDDPEVANTIEKNQEALIGALEDEGFLAEPIEVPPTEKEPPAEVPPSEEIPPQGEKVPEGKKRRRVAERILQDPNISEEIKQGLSENAKNYIPVSNETTEHEAQAIIDTKFTVTGSHDQSIKAITNTNNAIPPRIRVVMAGKVIDSLNKQMAETEEADVKEQFQDDAIKVAEFVTEYGTRLGQGIQAFNIWARINTETIVTKFNNDMQKIRGEKLNADEERKLRNYSKKIRNAHAGFQKNKAIQDMLAYQMRLKGIKWNDVGMAVWYSHVLSGYSTQMLNILANAAETMMEVYTSMVYNPKAAPWVLRGLYSGYGRGLLEAWATLKTGYAPVKSIKYDMAKDTPSVLEAYQGFKMFNRRWNPFVFHKYVARAMSAADTFFYHGLKGMRSYELTHMEVDGKGKSLSEVNNLVNDKLSQTRERKGKVRKQLEVESQERYTELRLEKEQIQRDLAEAKDSKVREEIQREIKRIDKEIAQAKKRGEQVYKKGSAEYKRRFFELMEETVPDQVLEDANNIASRGTFNYETEGRLGMVTDTVASLSNKPGLRVIKFVVPFTRIISNVANRYLDWTPYGFVRGLKGGIGYKPRSEWGRSKYSKGYTREEQVKEYIKASTGTLAAVLLLMLSKGKDDEDDQQGPFEITANGTGDYRKNYNLKETGWQAYSIRIGDKWYSYANTPLAIPLQVIGTLNDMKKYRGEDLSDKNMAQKTGIALWNTFRYFTDLTFLQGLSEFLTSFNENEPDRAGKYFERFATGAGKGFIIPNLFTQVSRQVQSWMDLPIKEANEMWEKFYRDVPVARKGLNDMVNGLGELVIPDTDRYISQVESDPVWELIVKNNAWIGKPPKTIRVYDLDTGEERPLDNDEYYNYSKLRGEKLKSMIVGNLEKLQAMDQEGVNEQIDDYKRRAGKEAKAELILGSVSYGLYKVKKENPKAFEALKKFQGYFAPSSSQSIYIGEEERYMIPEELDEYRMLTLDNYIKEAGKVTGNFDMDKMQRMADQEIPVGSEVYTDLQIALETAWAVASAEAYATTYERIQKKEK